jgi:ribokinase
MTAGFDVIVCGSLHLDIMVYSPSLPRPDETVTGSRWALQCGGKGANQAVMAARAGARVAMIGRVGADDFGARLRSNLIEAGVDASAVSIDDGAGSGMSVAIVRDDGEYGAVIVSGANLRIGAAEPRQRWRALGGASVLILQNEIPEAANIASAREARARGARVAVNAAPARAMTREMLDLVDVLIVNRVEAEMLSGLNVADAPSALRALPRLGAGERDVIVTLGGEGLVAQAKGEAPMAIDPVRVPVMSTHGAGDCFVGAFAARIARGAGLIEAARAANAAAAAHVAKSR